MARSPADPEQPASASRGHGPTAGAGIHRPPAPPHGQAWAACAYRALSPSAGACQASAEDVLILQLIHAALSLSWTQSKNSARTGCTVAEIFPFALSLARPVLRIVEGDDHERIALKDKPYEFCRLRAECLFPPVGPL